MTMTEARWRLHTGCVSPLSEAVLPHGGTPRRASGWVVSVVWSSWWVDVVAPVTRWQTPSVPRRPRRSGRSSWSAVLQDDRLVTLTTKGTTWGDSDPDVAISSEQTRGDAFVAQYEDFIAAARDHRAPLVDVASGVQTLG
jgi:hypothetical protein